MMLNQKVIVLVVFFITQSICSQQEAAFSLYMFNHQSINPAYVGAQTYTQITAVNKLQWTGIYGSPETQAISFGHQFQNKNLGIGFSSVVDKLGPTQNTSTAIDVAYHLKLNDNNLKLGFGIKLSGRSYLLDSSMISLFDSSDPIFAQQPQRFFPNIGAGFYLHNQKFYAGFGLPYLLEDEELAYKRNYYLIFGGLFNLNKTIELKPSFLFQKTQTVPLAYDTSVLFVVNSKYWIGPQFRANFNSLLPNQKNAGYYGAIAGVHIGDKITLGYSYQGPTGNQNIGITNSSHELLLRFQLSPKNIGVLRSPRLF
tara:strand:- start:23667 stop:24602 length:936 start_codon:yes stop_codon:yes gene_type:complete